MNKFHTDGTRPEGAEIFVFGSNLAGVHGAGAAAAALNMGAEWGKGVGMQGKTYAIPTKDKEIKSLRLSQIQPYIEQFVEFTKANPDKKFFVTRIGCVLAGYKDNQVAPLFKDAVNCSFAKEWERFVAK
jgi:hypothetical protein